MRYVTFRGLMPKVKPTGLAVAFGTVAENLDLYRETLLPLRSPRPGAAMVSVDGTPFTGTARSMFKLGAHVVAFPRHTWVVPDPRIEVRAMVYTDAGALWWQSENNIRAQIPPVKMGVCRPAKAPTGTVLTSGGCNAPLIQSGCDSAVTSCQAPAPMPVAFAFTWLRRYPGCDAYIEESQPSDPTAFDLLPGEAVVLSSGAAPDGVAQARWYVAIGGTKGATWLHAGDAAPGAFLFNKCAADLGQLSLPIHNGEPPCGIQGVATLGDGMLLVWSGRHIWASEPFLPYAFDHDIGRRTLEWDVVGGIGHPGRMEGEVYAQVHLATDGYPYVVTGQVPEKVTVRQLHEMAACIDPQSICDMSAGRTGWATRFGFHSTTGERVVSETDAFMTNREWMGYAVYGVRAFYHNERVWMFNDTRDGLVLGIPSEGGQRPRTLSTTTMAPTAAFTGPDVDALVALPGDARWHEWLQGEYMQWRWRSEEALFAGLWRPSAAKVVASRGRRREDDHGSRPVSFALVRDGVACSAHVVKDDSPFRLRSGGRALNWACELTGRVEVTEVHYNTSIADLAIEGGNT